MRALRERSPGSDALARFDTAAKVMTGNPNATAADGVTWIKARFARATVPQHAQQDLRVRVQFTG